MLQLNDHCHLSQVAPSSTNREDTSASIPSVSDPKLQPACTADSIDITAALRAWAIGYQPVASPVPSGTKSESFHRATPVGTANAREKRQFGTVDRTESSCSRRDRRILAGLDLASFGH